MWRDANIDPHELLPRQTVHHDPLRVVARTNCTLNTVLGLPGIRVTSEYLKVCLGQKNVHKSQNLFVYARKNLHHSQSLFLCQPGQTECTPISKFACFCVPGQTVHQSKSLFVCARKNRTPISKFVVPGQTVLLYQSLFVCCCARINCTPISKSVCLLLCQDKLYSYIKVSLFCCARINCTQSWCPTCSGPYLLGSATFPSTSRSSTTWSMTSGRCLIRQGGVWDHWIIR